MTSRTPGHVCHLQAMALTSHQKTHTCRALAERVPWIEEKPANTQAHSKAGLNCRALVGNGTAKSNPVGDSNPPSDSHRGFEEKSKQAGNEST